MFLMSEVNSATIESLGLGGMLFVLLFYAVFLIIILRCGFGGMSDALKDIAKELRLAREAREKENQP